MLSGLDSNTHPTSLHLVSFFDGPRCNHVLLYTTNALRQFADPLRELPGMLSSRGGNKNLLSQGWVIRHPPPKHTRSHPRSCSGLRCHIIVHTVGTEQCADGRVRPGKAGRECVCLCRDPKGRGGYYEGTSAWKRRKRQRRGAEQASYAPELPLPSFSVPSDVWRR